jgi:hypothetical protein
MVAESVDAGGIPSQNPPMMGYYPWNLRTTFYLTHNTNHNWQVEAHRFLGEILILWRKKIA